jgi:hypothetical protein
VADVRRAHEIGMRNGRTGAVRAQVYMYLQGVRLSLRV